MIKKISMFCLCEMYIRVMYIFILFAFCIFFTAHNLLAVKKEGMKVFIITDMEGTAGVYNFEDYAYPTGKYYELARKLVTGEVSAAVQGALDGGATEVIVLDGHGAGAINIQELHPEAKLIAGGGYDFTTTIDSTFSAAFMIGQHPMAHAPGGNMDHSWSSQTIHAAWLNGKEIGEIGVNTILAGYYGIPMVLLTGDTAACNEMKALIPNAVTVAVKEGISRASARSLSLQKARELIRTGAKEAIQRLSEIQPYFVEPPYTFIYQYHKIVGAGHFHLPKDEKVLPEMQVFKANDFLELLRKK